MEEYHRTTIHTYLKELIEETTENHLKDMIEIFMRDGMLNGLLRKEIEKAENPKETFYVMVTTRGPKAFETLCSTLTSVGLHSLSQKLQGKNRNGTEMTDGNEIGKLQRSTNNNKRDNNNIVAYPYSKIPRGICLIINNSRFPFFEYHNRHGSEIDVKRLKHIMQTLGFEVKVKENLKSSELIDYLNIFVQKKKLKHTQSVFVFLMSHGKEVNGISGSFQIECVDNSFVRSDNIIEKFDANHCPYMATKPKIIVFNACRGPSVDTGVAIQFDHNNDESIQENIKLVPKLSDLLLVYSTLPGYVSMRNGGTGSYFIQALCDELELIKITTNIEDIFNRVSRKLKEMAEGNELPYQQIVHIHKFGFDKGFLLDCP